MSLLHALAPAKINLTLKVLGRRSDGYHLLDSLVVFAAHGDTLTLDPSQPLGVQQTGTFAHQLGVADDNLVLKVARQMQEAQPHWRMGQFVLNKALPVASGMGGGSSDAAAALRLLARLNDVTETHPDCQQIAKTCGADILVCLMGKTCRMQGIGEHLTPVTLPHGYPAVLLNVGVALSTREVFAQLNAPAMQPHEPIAMSVPYIIDDMPRFLAAQGNDLLPPALSLAPLITQGLNALHSCAPLYAGMSGSGATLFALFSQIETAQEAARLLKEKHPDWWVMPTVLGVENDALL